MTRQQSQALAYIASYLERHGQPPTFAEIAKELNLKSKSGAARIVKALEELGLIRRWRNRKRSIEIIEPGEVRLKPDIFRMVADLAKSEGQPNEAIVNRLLRGCLLGASL